MARLTWRNVDAPNFSTAANILNRAGQNLQGGFDSMAGIFQDVRDRQIDERSAEALGVLAGVRGPGDVDAALAQVLSQTQPGDRNDELNTAILNLRNTALGYDETRAGIRNTDSLISDRAGRLALAQRADNRAQSNWEWADTRRRQEAELARNYASLIAGEPGSAPDVPLDDRELLARTLMGEAGGEGMEGMIAAGAVINNRANLGRYGGGDLRSVILQPGQFSAWNGVTGYANGEGALDMMNMTPSQEAYAAADAILSGQYEDPTNGATHYYNDSAANPEWGQARAGGEWSRIGNHLFGSPDGVAGGRGNTPLQRRSIASLLPENSVFSMDEVLGLIDRRNSDIENENTQFDRALREQVRTDVYGLIRDLGPNAMGQARDMILNAPDLSPRQREMYLQEFAQIIGDNQDYFQSDGSGPGLMTGEEANRVDELLGSILDSNTAAVVYDPAAANLGQVDLSGGNGVPVEGGGGSNPGTNGSSGGSLASQIARLNQTLATDDNPDPIDRDSVLRTVQRIAEQTGLPVEVIMSQAENSLTDVGIAGGMFSNAIGVDERILLRNLAPYLDENGRASPQSFMNVSAQNRLRQQIVSDARLIQSEMSQIEDEFNIFSRRPDTPENRQRLTQLQERQQALMTQLQGLSEQARGIAGIQEFSAPSTEVQAPAGAQAPNQGLSRMGVGAVTPEGRYVDPFASNFDRTVSRVLGEREVAESLSGIQVDLATGGGSPMNRFVGSVTDFFRPENEAEVNRMRRQEYREVLDWFRSREARNLFVEDPILLREANEDPIGFYERRIAGR